MIDCCFHYLDIEINHLFTIDQSSDCKIKIFFAMSRNVNNGSNISKELRVHEHNVKSARIHKAAVCAALHIVSHGEFPRALHVIVDSYLTIEDKNYGRRKQNYLFDSRANVSCDVCGQWYPIKTFTLSQLRKGAKARCKVCVTESLEEEKTRADCRTRAWSRSRGGCSCNLPSGGDQVYEKIVCCARTHKCSCRSKTDLECRADGDRDGFTHRYKQKIIKHLDQFFHGEGPDFFPDGTFDDANRKCLQDWNKECLCPIHWRNFDLFKTSND